MLHFRPALLLAFSFLLANGALASQSSQPSQAAVGALTNKDVLEMLKAGLGQKIVIAKIKSSNCAFDTSPDALKALKAANVPDAVILEMVQAPSIKREKQVTDLVLPPLDQILEKYIQSLGGKEVIEKRTTNVIKGSFEYQGKRGTIEGYWKAPNKFSSVMDSPEFGRAREGFDGFVAWADDPQTGLREKRGGEELSMMRRYSDFYYPLHLSELYPKMTLKGEQKVGDHRTYLVEADPGDGSLERMYFDSETGVLARTDTESDSPPRRITTTWYFDDYREVDGTKVAFSRRRSSATEDFVVSVSEVLHNAPVDDAIFTKPTVSTKTQSSSAPSSTLSPNVLRTAYVTCVTAKEIPIYATPGDKDPVASPKCGAKISVLNEGDFDKIQTEDGTVGYIAPYFVSKPNVAQTSTVTNTASIMSSQSRSLPASMLRAVAWRGVPWVTTSYYQQQGSANTSCTGSGTWIGNIWQGNSSCTTQYTPAQSVPINWQHYTIYNLVETSDSMMVLACTRNWAFSKCAYLIPGNTFEFENKKGKISIKAHKAGKDKEQTLELDIVSSEPKASR
jgi:hypothetical protein